MFIHTWSLACEEQFYLIWPLLMVLLCGLVKGNRQRAVVLFSMFVLLAFYRWAMTYHWGVERIYNGLDTRSDGLLLGAAVAMAFSTGRRVVVPLSGLGGLAALGVLAAVSHYEDWYMLRYGYFACAILAAVVIWDCVSNPTGLTARMLSNRPLVYAGKISYGIYLWHYPVFHVLRSFDIFWAPWRVLFVGSVISLVLATASYYLVERKFLALKGRFVRGASAVSESRPPVGGPAIAGSVAN
jgi:peptidoglycan/LPS O-acetylase OafA/YrhL